MYRGLTEHVQSETLTLMLNYEIIIAPFDGLSVRYMVVFTTAHAE